MSTIAVWPLSPLRHFPAESENLSGETLTRALQLLKLKYGYIVADLPHDFSDIPLHALDEADIILMVASPEMASVRAATAALDTYDKIGYPREKVKLVLNATFPRAGLPKDKIETALGMTAVATIPYVQDMFVEAINLGRPPVYHKPQEPVSSLLEDFAFFLSRDTIRRPNRRIQRRPGRVFIKDTCSGTSRRNGWLFLVLSVRISEASLAGEYFGLSQSNTTY